MSTLESTLEGRADAGRGRLVIFAMAAAAGLAVANIYYNQPMLAVMEQDLPGPLTAMVPTATQLGYALGLFALVPLGDLVERRRLIVGQFVVLALALLLAAVAPTPLTMLVASAAVGVAATVAQQIVPFAAHLAPPEKRGATVGFVLSGIFTGILLSRTLAGLVAAHFGWRAMFWLGMPLALVAGLVMSALLPRSKEETGLSYGGLMASLLKLWRELPALRRASYTQALLFAAFSAFWTTLAFRLAEPRFGLGADVAGLFGIVGVVGIVCAPIAGRLADRVGAQRVVLIGSAVVLASFVVFALWGSIPGLVVGVIVLDFGLQYALVPNQHIVFGLRPEARSRLNTLFIGSAFLGGAVGSSGAALAWAQGGWTAVTAFGIVLAALATAIQLMGRRKG